VNLHLRNNCSEKRKVRNDAGRTIFNSPEMRERTYTPYNHFKKLQRKNNPGVTIRDKELKEAYDKLDELKLHEMHLCIIHRLQLQSMHVMVEMSLCRRGMD
jgi:hypothetical protein